MLYAKEDFRNGIQSWQGSIPFGPCLAICRTQGLKFFREVCSRGNDIHGNQTCDILFVRKTEKVSGVHLVIRGNRRSKSDVWIDFYVPISCSVNCWSRRIPLARYGERDCSRWMLCHASRHPVGTYLGANLYTPRDNCRDTNMARCLERGSKPRS